MSATPGKHFGRQASHPNGSLRRGINVPSNWIVLLSCIDHFFSFGRYFLPFCSSNGLLGSFVLPALAQAAAKDDTALSPILFVPPAIFSSAASTSDIRVVLTVAREQQP